MDDLVFKKFNLAKPSEHQKFQAYKDEFLRLLANSYRKYFGNERYIRKIQKRNLTIILAVHKQKVIGCLIIKAYEKMSGLAVAHEFRRKGVASALVMQAQKEFDYLYGEVQIKSQDMRGLLDKLRFRIVKDKAVLAALLHKQNEEFSIVDETPEYLSFIHDKDISQIDRRQEFIIYDFEATK